jgi:hypothetical protein
VNEGYADGRVRHRCEQSGAKRKFSCDHWEVPLRPILSKWSEEAYVLLRFMNQFEQAETENEF